MPEALEVCPNCGFTLLERRAYCPHCGAQIGHPFWKKLAAWLLLVLIGYALVTCHLRLLDGFPEAGSERPEGGSQPDAETGLLNGAYSGSA
jgi:hypothetical protein